jgi:hypothetical protein
LGFNFNSEFELDLNTLQAAFKQPNRLASGQSQEERSILLAKLQAAVVLYRAISSTGFSGETPLISMIGCFSSGPSGTSE